MKASFTTDEMIHNSVLKGAQIYYDGVKEVIDYVKLDKKTRQIVFHCESGEVFSGMQDEEFEFEVNNKKELKKVTKKRIKGKR